MFIKITALVALALAAQALPTVHIGGWNKIVGARREIFSPAINSVQSKSTETAAILSELNELLAQDTVLNSVYIRYLTSYSKDKARFYSSASKATFKTKLMKIAQHNLEASQGKFTWLEGFSRFTDMSKAEYARYQNGQEINYAEFFSKSNITVHPAAPKAKIDFSQQADIDWSAYATPVKDQGSCGSCYAFEMVGTLEANYVKNGGPVLDLAEQQIVDCSTKNRGCNGGWADNAAAYLKDGIALEADYPYKAVQGTCQAVQPAGPVVLSAQEGKDEAALYTALLNGPVDVSVSTHCDGFQDYQSGVLQGSECGTKTGHAVVAIGWSSGNEAPHWYIKNSWADDWGDKGYIRIASGSNVAGIGTRWCSITTN